MILFFDTETSGLPKNYKAPPSDTANWPRMVQIGWIISAEDNFEPVEEREYIVRPEGFIIPKAASDVHKITNDRALTVGIPIKSVLQEFQRVAQFVDVVVGHNIDFDLNIIRAEFIRANLEDPFIDKHFICTMKASTNYCRIPGPYGFKWPKLEELYTTLFQKDMGHAHTALADIQNTAHCYYELVKRDIIK